MTQEYEYCKEIYDYDGEFVLSVEFGDAYKLMNHSSIKNPEDIGVGKMISFNVNDEGIVTQAKVEE